MAHFYVQADTWPYALVLKANTMFKPLIIVNIWGLLMVLITPPKMILGLVLHQKIPFTLFITNPSIEVRVWVCTTCTVAQPGG